MDNRTDYTQAMVTEHLRYPSLDTRANSHFRNYNNYLQLSPIQDISSDTSVSPLSPASASSSSMFSHHNTNAFGCYTHAHHLGLQPSPSHSSSNDSSYNQNNLAIFSPSTQKYIVDSDSYSNISASTSDMSPYHLQNPSLNINNGVVQSGLSLQMQGGGWLTSSQYYCPSVVSPGITGMESPTSLALHTYDALNAHNSVESPLEEYMEYAIEGEIHTLPTVKKRVGSQAILEASGRRRKKLGRYECPICMSTLTAKHNLTHHINSHKGIKKFQCRDCLRLFGTPHVLKRHVPKCKGVSKREGALLVKKEELGHCNAI